MDRNLPGCSLRYPMVPRPKPAFSRNLQTSIVRVSPNPSEGTEERCWSRFTIIVRCRLRCSTPLGPAPHPPTDRHPENVLYDHPVRNSFQRHIEPTHHAASSIRHEARRLLDGAGVPSNAADDIELIIAELAANAVEQQTESPIEFTLAFQDGVVEVTVVNEACGGHHPGTAIDPLDQGADELADRGWGLAIVEHLSDEVTIEVSDGWTSVRAVRRHGATAAGPDERSGRSARADFEL